MNNYSIALFLHVLGALGFFIVLPVLAEFARTLPEGEQGLLVGLVIGSAGLAQACLQIPMGWASDRFGRKLIIVCGPKCKIAENHSSVSTSDNLIYNDKSLVAPALHDIGHCHLNWNHR